MPDQGPCSYRGQFLDSCICWGESYYHWRSLSWWRRGSWCYGWLFRLWKQLLGWLFRWLGCSFRWRACSSPWDGCFDCCDPKEVRLGPLGCSCSGFWRICSGSWSSGFTEGTCFGPSTLCCCIACEYCLSVVAEDTCLFANGNAGKDFPDVAGGTYTGACRISAIVRAFGFPEVEETLGAVTLSPCSASGGDSGVSRKCGRLRTL